MPLVSLEGSKHKVLQTESSVFATAADSTSLKTCELTQRTEKKFLRTMIPIIFSFKLDFFLTIIRKQNQLTQTLPASASSKMKGHSFLLPDLPRSPELWCSIYCSCIGGRKPSICLPAGYTSIIIPEQID